MSTRANIIVKDAQSEQIFYKHSDGYPEGTMPLLEKFLGYVKDGLIRSNVSQGAPWLIVLGHQEYVEEGCAVPVPNNKEHWAWKVGSIELTDCIHSDIEYLYTVDLVEKTITVENK